MGYIGVTDRGGQVCMGVSVSVYKCVKRNWSVCCRELERAARASPRGS